MEYQPFVKAGNIINPVPMDTDSLRDAANAASQTYWNNRSTADLMEIQLAKLNIAPEYEYARANQMATYKKGIGDIVNGQGFLGATSKIANMIKQYQTNPQLNTALSNTDSYDKFKKESQDLYNAGKYDSADYAHTLKLNRLPQINQVNQFGVYDKFEPTLPPQQVDIDTFVNKALAGYEPDSSSSQVGKFETGSMPVKSITSSGKTVMNNVDVYTGKSTSGSYHSDGSEAGVLVKRSIANTPEVLDYLKHKVSIDLTNEDKTGRVYSWKDISNDDPRLTAKINTYADNAIGKYTVNKHTYASDPIDPSAQMKRMAGTGVIDDNKYIHSTQPLTQSDKKVSKLEVAMDEALGGGFWSGVGKLLKQVGNVASASVNPAAYTGLGINPFAVTNQNAIDEAMSPNLRMGFEMGKSILKTEYNIDIKSLEDLQKHKDLLTTYLKDNKRNNAVMKESVDIIPYALNSNDENTKYAYEVQEKDYNDNPNNYTYYSTDDLNPYSFTELAAGKKEIPKVSVSARTTHRNHLGNVDPRLYESNVVTIDGKSYFATNPTGIDARPINRAKAIDNQLWSLASQYKTKYPNASRGIEVPLYIGGLDASGFPIMSNDAIPNGIKLTSRYNHKNGRPNMTYRNAKTGAEFSFDPTTTSTESLEFILKQIE